MKTGEMHEHRPQLLQKHYVLFAKVRSAKFLHNKSCEVFFPPHFSPGFSPSSLPVADEGQREGDNKTRGQEEPNL